MEKINIAKLLEDCPKGMELDCTMFNDVTFVKVGNSKQFPIEIVIGGRYTKYLTKEGCFHDTTLLPETKCVIFPKGKTTWEGFVPPCQFKDGDILINTRTKQPFILKFYDLLNNNIHSYCGIDGSNKFLTGSNNWTYASTVRLATEEEKQKLFDAIKADGYKWNAETKTLEKLQKFKEGDVVVSSMGNIVLVSHIDDKQVIYYHCILSFPEYFRINETPNCGVGKVDNCTLASDSQKKRLFDRLKNSGYKYNLQTNKLEKLIVPKFKVGDLIENKDNYKVTITEVNLEDNVYGYESLIAKGIGGINFNEQGEWELVHNKFDITTLKPFDKVLVRHNQDNKWCGSFFSHIDEDLHSHCYKFVTTSGKSYPYCIPYEPNKHLLGTTDEL